MDVPTFIWKTVKNLFKYISASRGTQMIESKKIVKSGQNRPGLVVSSPPATEEVAFIKNILHICQGQPKKIMAPRFFP
jgi:hypothetical protein